MPNRTPDIILQDRDYASHGWSVFAGEDQSAPAASGPFVPLPVGGAIRLDTVGATGSELHFAGLPNRNGQLALDGFWGEELSFLLPEDLALGNYTFSLTNVGAFDTNGAHTFGALEVGSLAISVVSEPATYLLFAMVLAGLA